MRMQHALGLSGGARGVDQQGRIIVLCLHNALKGRDIAQTL